MSGISVFKPILVPVLVPSWLLGVAIGAIMPVLALAALGIGATQAFAAVLVGIMGAVSLCLTVPAGILIDRLGDTRAMILAGVGAIAVMGLIVVALAWRSPYSLPLYTACIVLLAPVTDIWSLARQALVAETMPSERMGMAMTALGGSQRIGNLVGPLVGAALMAVFPIWSVFVFSAVAAAVAALVVSLPAGRALDTRRKHMAGEAAASAADVSPVRGARPGPPEGGDMRDAGAASPAKESAARRVKGPALRELDVRWGPVVLAGIAIVTLTVARAGQPVVVQLWGVELGLHKSAISLLVALGAALELVFMFAGAYIKDRLGRATTLVTCLGVFGLGFLVLVLLPSAGGMVAGVVVMALGNGLGAGINMTIGADLSPAVGRARFLGVWAVFNNVGKLGGPAVISFVIAVASLRLGILFTGVTALAGAVWTVCCAGRVGLPGHRRTLT